MLLSVTVCICEYREANIVYKKLSIASTILRFKYSMNHRLLSVAVCMLLESLHWQQKEKFIEKEIQS